MRGAWSNPRPAPISARSTTVTAIEPGGRVDIVHPDDGARIVEGRCILLATGIRETPRSARLVTGTRPLGVITTGALQQMVYLEASPAFARAVIVGTELVSFSALLTARHGGIKIAAMIEEGERITARKPGDWIARPFFGVPVLTGTKLVAIRGSDQGRGCRDRAAWPARNHRLRRRHLHRPLHAGDGAAQDQSHRTRSRQRWPHHRSVLPHQRSPDVRRRQSAAACGDRRHVLGRGPHRRRQYRRRPCRHAAAAAAGSVLYGSPIRSSTSIHRSSCPAPIAPYPCP